MTAVIWCESVLTSVAVWTLEIAAARRCLKCGLRCKQPRFTSVSVLLKDSRILSTVWPHCQGFPSHSGGQLWYKCLSWSSDAEKKVTARTKLLRHNMVFAQRVQYIYILYVHTPTTPLPRPVRDRRPVCVRLWAHAGRIEMAPDSASVNQAELALLHARDVDAGNTKALKDSKIWGLVSAAFLSYGMLISCKSGEFKSKMDLYFILQSEVPHPGFCY